MSSLEKLEEKRKSLQKKIESKKDKIQKSLEAKHQKKDMSKKLMPAMFDMLVVVVNRGRGQVLLNYLKSINLNLNVVSFGEGTAPTNIAGVLGFSQEKEVIFSVISHNESDKILDLLDGIFLSTEKYFGIAFTIPLKSITNNSLDTFNTQNVKDNGGK